MLHKLTADGSGTLSSSCVRSVIFGDVVFALVGVIVLVGGEVLKHNKNKKSYREVHLLVNLGLVYFDYGCSTPFAGSAWADKKLAELAEQLGKMVGHLRVPRFRLLPT